MVLKYFLDTIRAYIVISKPLHKLTIESVVDNLIATLISFIRFANTMRRKTWSISLQSFARSTKRIFKRTLSPSKRNVYNLPCSFNTRDTSFCQRPIRPSDNVYYILSINRIPVLGSSSKDTATDHPCTSFYPVADSIKNTAFLFGSSLTLFSFILPLPVLCSWFWDVCYSP